MKYFSYGTLLALLLFAAYVCFFKLGTFYLSDWDEAWYAEITKGMLKTHQFIVPVWNHAFHFDKPPLYMWLSALASLLFGLSEFSVRIISAVAGFLTITIAVLYSYRKWGLVPAFFAFTTLALNNVFIWRVRSGNLDALASLFIFLTYFVLISKHKYKYAFLGVLLGLIYLTKASLVFLPIGVYILSELFYEWPKKTSQIKEYLKVLGIFTLISGIWLFLGYLQAGSPFLNYFLFSSDQDVSKMSLAHFKWDYWSYAFYALQRRFFYLFILGIAALIWKIKKRENFIILVYSVALLLQLSFTERNNNWYLIPSMPFWSLAVAYAVFTLGSFLKDKKYVFYIPLLLVSLYISAKTFKVNITPILFTETNLNHVQTAKKIKTLTKENDVIVRMDHLYPSTIYYSDRKVISSPVDARTVGIFQSRDDVAAGIRAGKYKWLLGIKTDLDSFISKYSIKTEKTAVNAEEEIVHVK